MQASRSQNRGRVSGCGAKPLDCFSALFLLSYMCSAPRRGTALLSLPTAQRQT